MPRCRCRGATPAVRLVALATLAQRWRVSLRVVALAPLVRRWRVSGRKAAWQVLHEAAPQLVHEAEQLLLLGVALLLSPHPCLPVGALGRSQRCAERRRRSR